MAVRTGGMATPLTKGYWTLRVKGLRQVQPVYRQVRPVVFSDRIDLGARGRSPIVLCSSQGVRGVHPTPIRQLPFTHLSRGTGSPSVAFREVVGWAHLEMRGDLGTGAGFKFHVSIEDHCQQVAGRVG